MIWKRKYSKYSAVFRFQLYVSVILWEEVIVLIIGIVLILLGIASFIAFHYVQPYMPSWFIWALSFIVPIILLVGGILCIVLR